MFSLQPKSSTAIYKNNRFSSCLTFLGGGIHLYEMVLILLYIPLFAGRTMFIINKIYGISESYDKRLFFITLIDLTF